MPKDKYSSFAELLANEKAGYYDEITSVSREDDTLIMAPHGRFIEPISSEIATCIARGDLSLYRFDGLRKRPHTDLHVTSHKYDEPHALEIVGRHAKVVAIHGRRDHDDPRTVWIGGCDQKTGDRIIEALDVAGFSAERRTGPLGGTDPKNICNRGRTAAGVQLEVPRSLRDPFGSDPDRLTAFADAVRAALAHAPG